MAHGVRIRPDLGPDREREREQIGSSPLDRVHASPHLVVLPHTKVVVLNSLTRSSPRSLETRAPRVLFLPTIVVYHVTLGPRTIESSTSDDAKASSPPGHRSSLALPP